jgi:hypothetical protein
MTVLRVLRVLLFGDVNGFSKTKGEAVPDIRGRGVGYGRPHSRELRLSNRFPQYLGRRASSKGAETAADCALELQRAFSELLLARSAAAAVAIFGPVFPLYDPILKQKAVMAAMSASAHRTGDA